MPTNQYLSFGTAGGAYVLSPSSYAALGTRTSGYPTGLLPKESLNTPLRLSSVACAALAQWCCDDGAVNMLDDGSIANFETGIRAGFDGRWKSNLNLQFIVYAGNPNTHVAGVAGAAGTQFPSVVFDISNLIWWVCTTTGNAASAVWTQEGAKPGWPFWCGTSTGTANAGTVTPPATMTALNTGDAIAWKHGPATNSASATMTITGITGAITIQKVGPTGPTNLTGGELDTGGIYMARYDGTNLQLTATDLGTASMQDASSQTGIVCAMFSTATVNRFAIFKDTAGTIQNGPSMSDATKTIVIMQSGAAVIGHIPKYSDIVGTQTDGYTPSDSTKSTVAMTDGAVISGKLTKFTDAAGTIDNGPSESSVTGTVASVTGAGSIVTGNLTQFSDANGTVQDSGTSIAGITASGDNTMYRLGLVG